MSIHKSLSLGSGLTQERSVFTRRERIERLMSKGEFEEGGSVYGLPKVRTRFKVLTKKQMKALVHNGDINLTSPEERGWLIRFMYHVFKYLDRFYIKRLSLPKLEWSLEHWYQEAQQPCLLGEPTPQFS